MAEEHNHAVETTEVEDRGLLDFVGKKGEEKADEEVLLTGIEKLHIEEGKLHGDDKAEKDTVVETEGVVEAPTVLEEEEKEECLEEMMEKLHEHKEILDEGAVESIAPAVKERTVESTAPAVAVEPEVAKEECLEEMMEKLHEHKMTLEEGAVESTAPVPPSPVVEPEVEKKSFLEKIKEKLPGFHKSDGEEGEKAAAASE